MVLVRFALKLWRAHYADEKFIPNLSVGHCAKDMHSKQTNKQTNRAKVHFEHVEPMQK